MLNRVIGVDSGGLALVRVRCFGKHTSRGAVVIYPHNFNHDSVNDGVPPGSYGGADLVGPPHRSVTLQILLSRKTVERHVSNILAKLEVKNRAQLAARMATSDRPR